MAAPLTGGLAPGIVLTGGYVVRVTALDPTTGATVAGVTVSGVSLQVDSGEQESEPIAVAPVVPMFAYGPAL